MISGLLSKENGIVDCDASAFIVKRKGNDREIVDAVTYDNPSGLDNMIVHHGDNAVNGGEEEMISINLSCLSADDIVVLTLDTLKDKNQVKTGKISQISVIIDDSEGKTELYRGSFNGRGDRAISIGEISCDGKDYYFDPELIALSNVEEKKDLKAAVKKESR
jgi:stress response protein SCP2